MSIASFCLAWPTLSTGTTACCSETSISTKRKDCILALALEEVRLTLTVGIAELTTPELTTTASTSEEHVEQILGIELIGIHPPSASTSVELLTHAGRRVAWITLCWVVRRVRVECCTHVGVR